MRHPRDMGVVDVDAFLSMMANERKVSASTHIQALSAILFLYREVLNIDLPWLNNIGRPHQTKRIPTVLTRDEVSSLLVQMEGTTALLARLLYGTGMRLMEGLRLRVKDVDFDRHAIVVREADRQADPNHIHPAIRTLRAAPSTRPMCPSGNSVLDLMLFNTILDRILATPLIRVNTRSTDSDSTAKSAATICKM